MSHMAFHCLPHKLPFLLFWLKLEELDQDLVCVRHISGVRSIPAPRGHCRSFDVGVYEWAFRLQDVFGVGVCGGKGQEASFVFPLPSSFSSVPTLRQ